MTGKEIVFVMDAGNTALKIGVFQNGELIENHRFEGEYHETISLLNKRYDSPQSILSSVLNISQTQKITAIFKNCFLVNNSSKFPINFDYKTPLTLGIDRICNAVASSFLAPNTNVVSIDIGTCIKFDFVDKTKLYHGGSISPGIQLRYKSLNDYTANLPLLHETSKVPLIGKSTSESIQSGVINGIQAEINDLMFRYTQEYKDLTFFMTGGDAQYFDFPRKNNIFVDENLTIKGLYQIYLLNAH